MEPLFAVGSTVQINGKDWTVVRYHQVNRKWEVLFRNSKGKHTSVPITTLETHVRLDGQLI